ncbi:MAG: type II secretion system protein [Phycisphaerales bacterium JB039]
MQPYRVVRTGFTLVEILIVVLILGILAALVVPRFATASEDAARQAFSESLLGFVDAATMYQAREGRPIPDGGTGLLPPGMEPYVKARDWENGTPIGGMWDSEFRDVGGMESLIGVHFMGGDDPGAAFMTQVDAIFDDGNLATGAFRDFGGSRYYYIIIE